MQQQHEESVVEQKQRLVRQCDSSSSSYSWRQQ